MIRGRATVDGCNSDATRRQRGCGEAPQKRKSDHEARDDQIIARSLCAISIAPSPKARNVDPPADDRVRARATGIRASFRRSSPHSLLRSFSVPRVCPTVRPSFPSCRRERTSPITSARRRTREEPRAASTRTAPHAEFSTAFDISAFCGITNEDALSAACTYCRIRLHSYAAIVSASPNCPRVECNELHHARAYVIPLRR